MRASEMDDDLAITQAILLGANLVDTGASFGPSRWYWWIPIGDSAFGDVPGAWFATRAEAARSFLHKYGPENVKS